MNKLSNIISRYDDMLYESRPSSLNEFLSNKYNNVHDELYNSALNKYIYTLVKQYIDKNLLYEYFQLLSRINILNEKDIVFDDIYKSIFVNEEYTPLINKMLNELSIDRRVFFKVMYDATAEKLNKVKSKLKYFYYDDNYDIQSAIEGITQITDIKDFRLVYFLDIISGESSERQMYTVYVDDNNEIYFNEEIVDSNSDDFDLVFTEDGDYVILYDYDDEVRIAYDKNGKWVLIVNSVHPIKNIDNLPTLVEKYMDYESKGLIYLYANVISNLYKRYHKIIEIKNSEYWMPSNIRIINKIPPYKKYNVDLSEYWNNIQSNNEYNLKEIKLTNNDNTLDSEIIDINYVNGKAKIQSRTTDIIYEVPFKYLDTDTDVSDEMILRKSFETKYH